MELRHLRYFIAVAREENVTRAALRLHVSQPALSRQIRDLEAELGVPLLERGAKSVRLTEAGKVFHAGARAVIQRADEAVKAARAAAAGGNAELNVGYAPSITVRFLPPALRAYQAAAPNVRVLLHDLSTEEMLGRLRAGALQIALLVRPTKPMLRGMSFEEILRDQICLAVAPRHRFARRKTITLAEVAPEPLLVYSRKDYPEYHKSMFQLFARVKARPRIAEEFDGIASLIAGVEAGGGVALVAESVTCLIGPRLKLIPIVPALEPLIIGAVWARPRLSPEAVEFLKCVQTSARRK